MNFAEFALDSLILSSLAEIGYKEPTPIQKRVIPLVLEGEDLIGLAETGSGKTAACAIPLCHRIDLSQKPIQALIVVPTRELALQYATETQKIGKIKKVKVFALFGGESMELQRAKLKDGVHILVATPGRLIDFIYARAIDLSQVKTLVLDEADQMLSMGFIEDLTFIMDCLVQDHQTLLFSATMPEEIARIAKTCMKNPKEVYLIEKKPAPESLEHHFLFLPHPAQKREELIKLLKKINPPQCLLFGNSRHEVEELVRALKKELSSVDFLHGGLEQTVRTIITNKFSKKKIRYLVATDIAARGLDFSGVTHVVHYHLPKDQETYLHRSGRTGRLGRTGVAITLITRRDLSNLRRFIKSIPLTPKWLGKSPIS